MLTDQALTAWMQALPPTAPKVIEVPLQEALGRVLAYDWVAKDNLPRFDKSAMDGYAVKAADTSGATQTKPVTLKLTEGQTVGSGQAKQIWTGNPIPDGANAVVMIEETEKKDAELKVYCQVTPGLNVSKIGEDIRAGMLIAKAGTRITPYHIGLAAALGYRELKVSKKPRIGIIATGNELAEVGTSLSGSLIYDSNKIMIAAECHELGAETTDYGIAKDDTEEIAQKIQRALKENDAVITTGGTSVGGMDLVPDAINTLGKPGVIVHGVALRPAMPTGVAVLEGKPILVLSGNPVASVVGFEVFGRPMVCRLLGMSQTEPRPLLKAVLSRKVASVLGRKTFVRVRVSMHGGEFYAEPVSAKGSGSISTMTASNGFLIVPENREGVTEGETVIVHMFSSVEVQG